jgi:pyrimidine operon attenuation protein/uracil phosphoribosyltransferase
MSQDPRIVLTQDDVPRMITRMAHEIIEKAPDPRELTLIGIRSRGVYLARRIARKIADLEQVGVAVGELDAGPYRDDRAPGQGATVAAICEPRVTVEEKVVVLVDDVIFRGRTIRAAMEAVAALGEPNRILVAVLVDRGARELPIRADVVGKNVDVTERERVNVMLAECDGMDQVSVGPWPGRHGAPGTQP